MVLKVRRSNSHVLRMLVWIVLLSLLTSASPVFAAKKPALPPRVGINVWQLFPELAEDLGVAKGLKGYVILWVYQGSPAEAAGVKPGDVLVKVQRGRAKPVEILDEAHFESAFKGLKAGQDMTLYVMRNGKETPIPVKPSTVELGMPVQPAPNAQPVTLKVAADGSGDTRTLAGALLRARPGDTLLISGKHAASAVWLDNLTLTSLDPAVPAEVSGIAVSQVKGLKIRNLTLTSPAGSAPGQFGISIHASNDVTVADSRIQGFMDGIRVESSDGVVLEGNTISQNVGGIYAQNSKNMKISRNLVLRNAREAKWFNFAGGICVRDGSAEIIQNTVLENQVSAERFRASLGAVTGAGILIINGNAVIANNLVVNNTIGIMVGTDSQATVEYNDVIGHSIQGGTWTRGNNEYSLQGAQANFLSQLSYQYKPQPIFPLINFEPDRHYYTPTLQFQPSQTNLMVDPLFADRLKDDYRLAPDSPLINRGRGGTYIGAFPPVVTAPAVSPVPTDAAASPSASGSKPVTPGNAPSTPQPATQDAGFRAWVQANTLFVQAEAVDAVLGRLHQRLAENQQNLERVKKAQVGVVPFAFVGAEGITLSASLSEDLTTAMINSGFNPADPGLLSKALTELGVKDSGQLDQNLNREIARRTNCSFLLVGSVSDRGQSLVVSVRLLEPETGQYLAAERLEIAKATN